MKLYISTHPLGIASYKVTNLEAVTKQVIKVVTKLMYTVLLWTNLIAITISNMRLKFYEPWPTYKVTDQGSSINYDSMLNKPSLV